MRIPLNPEDIEIIRLAKAHCWHLNLKASPIAAALLQPDDSPENIATVTQTDMAPMYAIKNILAGVVTAIEQRPYLTDGHIKALQRIRKIYGKEIGELSDRRLHFGVEALERGGNGSRIRLRTH